jgi:fumarate hydratase subunit alpha
VTEASPGTRLRELNVAVLRDTVAHLVVEANYRIPPDVLDALRAAVAHEQSPLGRRTLEQLVRNYEIAAAERLPVCQDSGVTVVLLETGQDVHWVGGNVHAAIDDGIRDGTARGYLRRSVTGDPLRLVPTAHNAQAAGVVHVDLVPGDRVTVTVAPKGFGSENMSALRMLTPADGLAGARHFVVSTVDRAGADACPPLIVGVGIGGTFESAAQLAKRAVLRPLTERHPRPDVAVLERDLLEEINRLGIGPQGLGGVVTALGVNVEIHPTHIAGLPVAVNIGCHSSRRMTVSL